MGNSFWFYIYVTKSVEPQERLIMMMNNKIDGIQRQYMFAVEPVKFFEAQKNPQAQKSSFDFNFISQMNSKGFNPFHPNVQTETTAKRLDFMS